MDSDTYSHTQRSGSWRPPGRARATHATQATSLAHCQPSMAHMDLRHRAPREQQHQPPQPGPHAGEGPGAFMRSAALNTQQDTAALLSLLSSLDRRQPAQGSPLLQPNQKQQPQPRSKLHAQYEHPLLQPLPYMDARPRRSLDSHLPHEDMRGYDMWQPQQPRSSAVGDSQQSGQHSLHHSSELTMQPLALKPMAPALTATASPRHHHQHHHHHHHHQQQYSKQTGDSFASSLKNQPQRALLSPGVKAEHSPEHQKAHELQGPFQMPAGFDDGELWGQSFPGPGAYRSPSVSAQTAPGNSEHGVNLRMQHEEQEHEVPQAKQRRRRSRQEMIARQRSRNRRKSVRYRQRKRERLAAMRRTSAGLHAACKEAFNGLLACAARRANPDAPTEHFIEANRELYLGELPTPYRRRPVTTRLDHIDLRSLTTEQRADLSRERNRLASKGYREEKKREIQAWECFLATMQQRARALNEVLRRRGLPTVSIEDEDEGSGRASNASSTGASSHHMNSAASEGNASVDARQSSGSTPPTPLLPPPPAPPSSSSSYTVCSGQAATATAGRSAVSLEYPDVQDAQDPVFMGSLMSIPEDLEGDHAQHEPISTAASLFDLPDVTLATPSSANLDVLPLDFPHFDGPATAQPEQHAVAPPSAFRESMDP